MPPLDSAAYLDPLLLTLMVPLHQGGACVLLVPGVHWIYRSVKILRKLLKEIEGCTWLCTVLSSEQQRSATAAACALPQPAHDLIVCSCPLQCAAV